MKGRKPSIAIFLVFALMAFTFFGSAATVMAQDQKTIYYTPQSQPSSISGMLEALYSSQSSAQGQQPQTAPESQQVWTGNQLDNLVAPVALYPDPLLSQMLVASTYPIEVVEANQWLQKNKNLRGKALVDAAQQQSWDSSVQALVAIPDALTKLNQDIRWTTDLGNAFLAQESDVMDAVQRMRERAQAGGRLASTPQQKITTQKESGKQAIVIEPSDPEVIYVPVYDPYYIWGPPLYGFYPPLLYPAFGFGFGIGYNIGFCFADWGGWGYWGWAPNWFGSAIFINSFFFDHYGYHHHHWANDFHHGKEPWVHDPGHRLNVPYGNDPVAARFGGRSSGLRNPPRITDRPQTAGGTQLRSQPRITDRPQSTTGRTEFRNPPRVTDRPPQVAARPNINTRLESRPVERSVQPRYRSEPSQPQRYANPPRQTYQPLQQFRSSSRTFIAPRVQPLQIRPQQRYQAPQMSVPRFNGGSNTGGFRGGTISGGGSRMGGISSGGGSRPGGVSSGGRRR
jgi:hypothetical protein